MFQSLRTTATRSCIGRSLIFQQPLAVSTRAFSATSAAQIIYVKPKADVPAPTENIPDLAAFLNAIGRKSIDHEETIGTWEKLMTMSSQQMKADGIDVRSRKYILAWREKFAKGDELCEIKRGKKSWGGERRRKAVKAEFMAKKYREEHHRRLKEASEDN
ncbi:mitochondrial 37S ribosomal protein mS41 [Magnusiomyces paraingens]|uniref:Small ribosomal subunit protein mS41 n=1 Tax=Magnusiomyces paraingens TaxID=2606893 RepID=A0A5E8B261_9ASCO|nr:uncharacterized protein SAPINGB_P000107 [Saprochaete ingens]VVT43702.1 unnamed protein product [Saprochaete ingens]